MKTWNLKVNEEELRALISMHAVKMGNYGVHDTETSSRIHDLTKRLNKTDAEITKDETGPDAKPEVKPDPWS